MTDRISVGYPVRQGRPALQRLIHASLQRHQVLKLFAVLLDAPLQNQPYPRTGCVSPLGIFQDLQDFAEGI